jgi:hypothetical protein
VKPGDLMLILRCPVCGGVYEDQADWRRLACDGMSMGPADSTCFEYDGPAGHPRGPHPVTSLDCLEVRVITEWSGAAPLNQPGPAEPDDRKEPS